MARAISHIKNILVMQTGLHAQTDGPPSPIGTLNAEQIRGKEVFSFGYEKAWLNSKPLIYSIRTCYYIPSNIQERTRETSEYLQTPLPIVGAES